jgi:hypothetical protein
VIGASGVRRGCRVGFSRDLLKPALGPRHQIGMVKLIQRHVEVIGDFHRNDPRAPPFVLAVPMSRFYRLGHLGRTSVQLKRPLRPHFHLHRPFLPFRLKSPSAAAPSRSRPASPWEMPRAFRTSRTLLPWANSSAACGKSAASGLVPPSGCPEGGCRGL